MPPLVVYVPAPMLAAEIDATRLARIHPDVELLTVPWEIDHGVRTARDADPWSRDLRDRQPPLTPEQRAAFGRAEVVFGIDVPMDLPPLAPALRWIQAIGSGVGQYVSARLPEGGITLTNGAGLGAVPIAEWALARVLQIVKRLPEHDADAREHRWRMAQGGLLEGRTVTIVGLGAIGRATARRARGFGVRIVGIRRSWEPGAFDPDVDELAGPDALHEVLGRSDVVILAAPGTAGNRDLFDRAAFRAMKPGGIFVNVARGTLVDEDALVEALADGHLAAAAIDVAKVEPLPADSRLWDTPNLYISPHSSTTNDGYAQRGCELFYRNLGHYVRGEPLENVVDMSTGY